MSLAKALASDLLQSAQVPFEDLILRISDGVEKRGDDDDFLVTESADDDPRRHDAHRQLFQQDRKRGEGAEGPVSDVEFAFLEF